MKKNKNILKLKDVIEVISEYDIKHTLFPHNYYAEICQSVPVIRGVALGDKRLILLDSEQSIEEMRETVIHELLHCHHYNLGDLRGYQNIERVVQRETRETYKKLYGDYP